MWKRSYQIGGQLEGFHHRSLYQGCNEKISILCLVINRSQARGLLRTCFLFLWGGPNLFHIIHPRELDVVKQCINIWLVFVLFASYLYSICYCHLPPSLGDVWSEIYLFYNIKRDFFGSVSRISSQLLFCISCPSVMRFAVSGINKQSGGSGNITECKSQGPKLICARFGDLGGVRRAIFALY